MIRKRKILLGAIIICLLLVAIGCNKHGGKETSNKEETTTTSTSETKEEPKEPVVLELTDEEKNTVQSNVMKFMMALIDADYKTYSQEQYNKMLSFMTEDCKKTIWSYEEQKAKYEELQTVCFFKSAKVNNIEKDENGLIMVDLTITEDCKTKDFDKKDKTNMYTVWFDKDLIKAFKLTD